MDRDLLQLNHVRTSGCGTNTLLFVHGLGTSHRIWDRLAPLLAHDYRLVTFDLAGCGDAAAPGSGPAYETLDGHAADLVAIASQLRVDGRITLVVHSIGAMIGLLADMQAPHLFDAHIMVCPAPCYEKLADYPGGLERADIDRMIGRIEADPVAWAREIGPAVMGCAPGSAGHEFFVSEIARAEPGSLGRFARASLRCDLRSRLPQLVKPTLIIQTLQDVIVPVAVSHYMQRALPDCELKLLDFVGHMPQHMQPEPCAEAMRRMLQQVLPG